MVGAEEVDVAVVGGGPGGSSAARATAAGSELDVVVFEKGVRRTDREGPGPDSTDAAGILDYWIELMDVGPDELDDLPILQEIDRAEFVSPHRTAVLEETGIDSWYEKFGFTFDRVAMDDLLRERAEEAGAEYRVGDQVKGVTSNATNGDYTHTLDVAGGDTVEADFLVLADGPQRRVTIPALSQFTSDDSLVIDALGPATANHIAYQQHRRFPAELFDDDVLRFWWGHIPGETAYPWFFPNDDNVARVGLTMPLDMDLGAVRHREDYPLLHPDDDSVPSGEVYIDRLLEHLYGDEYDVDEDIPIVEDRAKDDGVESYPISSTRPVESPTEAGVAVVGGAMGATSAFHEGGYHLAWGTGAAAGRLLAENGDLRGYNDAWQQKLGSEMQRNVCLAALVGDYAPGDFDRLFRDVNFATGTGELSFGDRLRSPVHMAGLKLRYEYLKRFAYAPYVQIGRDDYDLV